MRDLLFIYIGDSPLHFLFGFDFFWPHVLLFLQFHFRDDSVENDFIFLYSFKHVREFVFCPLLFECGSCPVFFSPEKYDYRPL
jgi:hypothetical protein